VKQLQTSFLLENQQKQEYWLLVLEVEELDFLQEVVAVVESPTKIVSL